METTSLPAWFDPNCRRRDLGCNFTLKSGWKDNFDLELLKLGPSRMQSNLKKRKEVLLNNKRKISTEKKVQLCYIS